LFRVKIYFSNSPDKLGKKKWLDSNFKARKAHGEGSCITTNVNNMKAIVAAIRPSISLHGPNDGKICSHETKLETTRHVI
jgi:hypothetical protein